MAIVIHNVRKDIPVPSNRSEMRMKLKTMDIGDSVEIEYESENEKSKTREWITACLTQVKKELGFTFTVRKQVGFSFLVWRISHDGPCEFVSDIKVEKAREAILSALAESSEIERHILLRAFRTIKADDFSVASESLKSQGLIEIVEEKTGGRKKVVYRKTISGQSA